MKPECNGSSGKSLGLGKVGFAFAVFGIGLFICFVALVMDMIRHKTCTIK